MHAGDVRHRSSVGTRRIGVSQEDLYLAPGPHDPPAGEPRKARTQQGVERRAPRSARCYLVSAYHPRMAGGESGELSVERYSRAHRLSMTNAPRFGYTSGVT
jgi:hypothetical protein